MKEKRKRILICDDDVGLLTVMDESLRARGYRPVTAETGKKCLEAFSQHSPDLVLLDLRLCDMDGRQVLQRLRTVDDNCPVIIMTGFGDQKLAAEVIKSGAMDYLVKPFRIGELAGSVESALRKADEIKARRDQEKLLLWGKLFPVVAHEIRTPLHSIGGALTLIRTRHQSDETTARALQIIHEEIVRLNEFVSQCLDFSRSPSKEVFTSIDLNDAVSSCIQLMRPFLKGQAKKVQVEMTLDDSLPEVYVNLHDIKQVLINLMRNAVEAIPKEGRVIIETHFKRDKFKELAQIKVIDNGIGIKKEDLAEVFAPFFSRKRSGVGLGLAVCKKLVEENHHGHIHIDSRPSKGTTVTVTFPIGTPGPRQ